MSSDDTKPSPNSLLCRILHHQELEGVRVGESNLDSHHAKIFATYPHANYAQLQILEKGIGEDALREVDSAILTGCIEAWEYIYDAEEASNV